MALNNFSVINNLQSASIQKDLGFNKTSLDKSLASMASGRRINQAADDAAGLAIANKLMADYTALTQGMRNANEAVGIIQIADGALSSYDNLLNRATQLATQAASDTVGKSEREALNTEFQQIVQEIDRMTETTNYKGEKLFSQDQAVTKNIFVGDTNHASNIEVSIAGPSGAGSQALGLQGVNLTTGQGATQALTKISNAIDMVSEWRGALGAQENRIANSIMVSQVQTQNLLAAESTIRDANMVDEISKFSTNYILLQSGMASMAQANAQNAAVLQLFRT